MLTPKPTADEATPDAATSDDDQSGQAGRSHPSLRSGNKIGRYVLLERVGSGGMGVVFSAFDPELDRRIAIKLLHRGRKGTKGDRARVRLLREAQAMARLADDNVVTVHHVGTHEGHVFLAMEYVDGWTVTEWIARKKPTWREVLDVFIRAGRGLASAHATGLIHRDFKPDNIMLSRDGRVRVMDFGLARNVFTTSEGGQSPELEDDGDPASGEDLDPIVTQAPSPSSEDNLLGSPFLPDGSSRVVSPNVTLKDVTFGNLQLTRAGAVLGTPAYMAPEQHSAVRVDERSDQFSFCVALFEGLYRIRPFKGQTPAALAFEIGEGRVRAPPKESSVPGRIHRALLRGLSVRREERWPSINALLAELERDPAAVRRRWAGATIVVAAAGLGLYFVATPEETVCAGSKEQLTGVWDVEREQAVRDAILATRTPFAKDTWARVDTMIDGFAIEWAAGHADACMATHVRREQSPRALDLRMACLKQRRRDLGAVVNVLAEADTSTVQNAVQAIAALTPPHRCADPATLAPELDPPQENARVEVDGIRRDIALTAALRRLARYQHSLELAERALSDARRVGYEPVILEARLSRAEALRETGAFAQSEQTLTDVYFASQRLGYDELTRSAAVSLVAVVGWRQSRTRDGLAWARHAQSDADLSEAQRIKLLGHLGHTLDNANRFEEARAHFLELLEIVEGRKGPRAAAVGGVVNNIGTSLDRAGDHAEAQRYYERALTIVEAALGPDHPTVGGTLTNIGIMMRRQGLRSQARERYESAIRILERSLGPRHFMLGTAMINLGNIATEENEYGEARVLFERSLAIWERDFGPDHPRVGMCLVSLANAIKGQGDYDRARGLYQRARDIFEGKVGAEHPHFATALEGAATLHYELQQHDQALELHRKALKIRERALGPSHPQTVDTLRNIGVSHVEQGQPERAIPYLERGLAEATTIEFELTTRVDLRWWLAQALWQNEREHERAVELARAALELLVATREPDHQRRAAIEAWLASPVARAASRADLTGTGQPKRSPGSQK